MRIDGGIYGRTKPPTESSRESSIEKIEEKNIKIREKGRKKVKERKEKEKERKILATWNPLPIFNSVSFLQASSF